MFQRSISCGWAVIFRKDAIHLTILYDNYEEWCHTACINMEWCIPWSQQQQHIMDLLRMFLAKLQLITFSINRPEPNGTSSPKQKTNPNHSPPKNPTHNMNVLTIKFQSIKSKQAALWKSVEDCNPHIILGCETWLTSWIGSKEVMPPDYDTYRKDWSDGSQDIVVIK